MRIGIASGKGGAGKTMLAASLHSVWPTQHILVDCDVEAPNLHFFAHPHIDQTWTVTLPVPQAVTEACSHCGLCRDICRYGAIAKFGQNIVVFPDLCHGCGGCFAVCQEKALVTGTRELGRIEQGSCGDTAYFSGCTRVGEVMTPPLLRKLLALLPEQTPADVIVDCPPGVSCPAVTVARRVDAMVLVADPTPFGYADFCLAYEAFHALGLPLACVLNRCAMPGNEGGDEKLKTFCQTHGIPVAGEVPFTREAAHALAQGRLLPELSPDWRTRFEQLCANLQRIFGEVQHG